MDGRVLQVNSSPGGVPKHPVDGPVHVGVFGLQGDGHRDDTVHGGPHRAVCLFAVEAIRRVAAEGHPIAPGSCGENLTTEGVELAELPIGTRLAIGDRLVLELASPDGPCSTIQGVFSDRRFSRIDIRLHPTDSRMYARVLVEGQVQAGDPITVLDPAPDSRAGEHALMARIDDVSRELAIANWLASEAAGLELAIVDDEELAMVACPTLPGRWRNQALGLDRLPHLIPRASAFFAGHRTTGWMTAEPEAALARGEDAATSDADALSVIHAIEPGRVPSVTTPGVDIREIGAPEASRWVEVAIAAGDLEPEAATWLPRMAPHLLGSAAQSHRHLYLAEEAGRAVGAARLFTHHRVGLFGAATVLPEARGRGIHRALIAARARAAEAIGCDLVAADGNPGTASERNQLAMGLVSLTRRVVVPIPPLATGGGGPDPDMEVRTLR
jgi:MOSC domain-containing protein YiiM/GNAT superfamily N-acetyltransferase